MKKQQLNFWLKQDKLIFVNNSLKARTATFNVVVLLFVILISFSPQCFSAINSAKIYQLQQRLISNPKDKEALLNLAMEYTLNNNFVKAVGTYFALLRIDPKNFHAYNNLGILYKKSGQFRDSLHCYKQAAKINPDSYWIPYNMGLCYEAMGRMQEARESYGSALSLNPGFTQALQRLRSLSSEGGTSVPALPALEGSGVYVASNQSSQPRIYNPSNNQPTVNKAVKPKTKTTKTKVKPNQIEKIVKKISEQKKKPKKYRTKRKGASASLFNQAMDALDRKNMERAIELYSRCVIADRNFLAEPDNGLIKAGLTYLKDRPNRMPNGLFYRGFFISISASLDLAIGDIKSYLEQNKSSNKKIEPIFKNEALSIVDRYEALVAERERLAQKEKQEKQAIKLAQESAANTENSENVTKPGAFVIKQMDVDQVINEADKLSRASRPKDAISVLKVGLESNPDNLRLLMKIANAYTDMLLLKGDKEAGKMALIKFEQIFSKAPENSTEWAVAKDMIKELKSRL